jgi:lipopolysaccharide/colanic/teichoic acid biosynthesis glycosyltransferase
MATLFHHSFPGRKAALFVAELSATVVAALAGAAVAAALAAGDGVAEGGAPLSRLLAALARGPGELVETARELFRAVAAGAAARFAAAAPWALLAACGCAASLYTADLYNLRAAAADREAGGRRTLLALGIVALALAVAAVPADRVDRGAALGAGLSAAAAVVLLRLALPAIVGRPERVLVVGNGARAAAVARAVEADAEAALEVAGLFEPGGELALAAGGAGPGAAAVRVGSDRGHGGHAGFGVPATPGGPAGSGGRNDLLAAARRARADRIVVALEDGRGFLRAADLVRCRLAGIPCHTPATFFERALRRIPVDDLRPSDLAFADGFRLSPGREAAKRTLDLAVAAAGVLLSAPLLAAAALAVRLGSPGPVFYRQERVGRHGRIFTITKLRTMRPDAEDGAPRWAEDRDPRVTPVGRLLRRTRIDELPQIFSVLAGDMSFVGPRPERPFFVERLKVQIPWYGLREAVRPGLTGWAQLRYPYGASVEDAKAKLEYDLYYLKNASVFLDISILFHTVRHVLTGRGAR